MTTTHAGVEDVQATVRGAAPGTRLLPVAGHSKPALSTSARDDVEPLDLSGLSGLIEYDPAELTFTALAGTPVREVQAALAEHGQYLPFDPPFASSGATLGGVVATGASGPGAWRHGSVRDFIIGVRFIDGAGNLVTGGGKVVKNAAGFDLPKLMVGSAGRLGVIVQLSFKVFPHPLATTTLQFDSLTLEEAVAAAARLARGPVELDALEITAAGGLLARIGGRPEALPSRAARLIDTLGLSALRHDGDQEQELWREAAEHTWRPPDSALVRVGLNLRQVTTLDHTLSAVPGVQIRYGIGGTVAWIAWPTATPIDHLDGLLRELGLPGMMLLGPPDRPRLGPPTGGAFGSRIAQALDPNQRFLEL